MSFRAASRLAQAVGQLGTHDHVCLNYETREQQLAAVIPFVQIGLDRGEQCVYIADDYDPATMNIALKDAGVDVERHVRSEALQVITKQQAYLKQGHFDPQWMIDFLIQVCAAAQARGFSALRVAGEMTWALDGAPGAEMLIDYESRLNEVFPSQNMLAICQYNTRRFSAQTTLRAIERHPTIILGEICTANPYYAPPGT